jgi:hypothetical protein
MRIIVWTRGRLNLQRTRKNFHLDSPEILSRWDVTYVLCNSEVREYEAKYPNSKTINVPDEWNASEIRHWLTYNYVEPDPFHVLMDDDLYFLRRVAPTDIRQRSSPGVQDAMDMFERIEKYLNEGYAHGGISIRAGNNRIPGVYAENTRVMDIHFYDARTFVEERINLAETPVMGDFHATLSLLELGYPNVLDAEFMSGQQDHTPGGCSRYRTVEMLRETAEKMARIHAPFVKVRYKTVKNSLAPQATLPDVTVYWKKSFGTKAHLRKYNPACLLCGKLAEEHIDADIENYDKDGVCINTRQKVYDQRTDSAAQVSSGQGAGVGSSEGGAGEG